MEAFQQNEKAQRDYQLVLAARERGDQRAYADLMGYYRDSIYMMLLRMTHSPVDADDLTIETFGNAFCQLNTYSPKNTFSTWLFSIASNKGIDYIRRQHMNTVALSTMSVKSDGEVYEFPMPSHEANPEEAMIGRQRGALIREVVEQLPARYRRIVKLRYYEEMSYDQIAEHLRIPLGTVKIQLLRARQLMAQIMQNHEHSL